MGKRPRLPHVNEEKKPGDYPGYPYYVSSEEVVNQNHPIEEQSVATKNQEDIISDPPEEVTINPKQKESENRNKKILFMHLGFGEQRFSK